MGRDNGWGERWSRNTNKGHMDKAKGGRIEGGMWGWVGRGEVVVGEMRQLYLNNNKKKEKNKFLQKGCERKGLLIDCGASL